MGSLPAAVNENIHAAFERCRIRAGLFLGAVGPTAIITRTSLLRVTTPD